MYPVFDVDEFAAEFSKYSSTLREVCNLFVDILAYSEDRVSLLHRFASKIEKLFDEFLQCDPDLFNDQLMATIPETNDFKVLIMELRSHPHVMERIFCDLFEEGLSEDLYSAAARICVTIAPFIHIKAFAEHENITTMLFKHAKSEHVELQTYALGLLSATMNYMDYEGLENDRVSLARTVLQRLSAITGSPDDVVSAVSVVGEDGPSVSTNACSNAQCQNSSTNDTPKESLEVSSLNLEQSVASSSEAKSYANGNDGGEHGVRPKSYSLHPLTVDIRHRVILCFLAHEWARSLIIPYAVEANLVEKLYTYLDENAAWNPWTVLNAVRCLEAMFSHPKVARVFVANDGVHRLLRIKPDTLPGTAIPAALCQLAQQGEAMESMCMMSHGAFRELIEYIVRVLECSHESARYDAADFLAVCFGFRRPLEHFDNLRGLRAICNNLGRIRENAQNESLTDGNYSLLWNNMARCFGTALKRYLEAHMLQKLEQLQQSSPALWSKQARRYHNIERTFVNEVGTIAEPQTLFSDRDFARECVTFLRENCSHCLDWYPIKELRRNDAIQLLIGIIDDCLTKLTVSSCQDCLSSILTVLWYASVSPVVQFDLIYTPHGEVRRNLFRREIIQCTRMCWKEGPVKRLAICIIGNCVCGPLNKYCKVANVLPNAGPDERTTRLIKQIWKAVRNNEGIQVLVEPLQRQGPSEDDEIDLLRICACDALIGLARWKPVRQIIEKLPLIKESKILEIIKENEKPAERPLFQELHTLVLHLLQVTKSCETTGINQLNPGQLYKQKVVAKTEILVNRHEMSVLVYRHLVSNGFYNTARQLVNESGFLKALTSDVPMDGTEPMASCSIANGEIETFDLDGAPQRKMIRLSGGAGESEPSLVDTLPPCSITLDSILKEHFRNQHAQCKKPVLACQPFSIFREHKCPEFRARCEASSNFTDRIYDRQYFPQYGGRHGFHKNLGFIYSRYCPLKACEDSEGPRDFSTCTFTADGKRVLLGTCGGDVGWYDLSSDKIRPVVKFHSHPISVATESKDRQLLLTATYSRSPRSVLWRYEQDAFVYKFSMTGDQYAEFDGPKETRIVGSDKSTAKIYDIATGSLVVKLYDEELENGYSDNRATFHSCGNVVLSDGIIWDVRTGKAIHKFDKLNDQVSGVFHPNGLDLVIDTAVWDFRTFRVRKFVDALHKHKVIFNSQGDVLFSIMRKVSGVDWRTIRFDSYVNVHNASDYSLIHQIFLRRLVLDIDVNATSSYLSTIETRSTNSLMGFEDNVCRIYSVGMTADSLPENESDFSSSTDSIYEDSEEYTADEDSDVSLRDFDTDTDADDHTVDMDGSGSESSRSSDSSESEYVLSTSTSD